jgi:hypothetical protein
MLAKLEVATAGRKKMRGGQWGCSFIYIGLAGDVGLAVK